MGFRVGPKGQVVIAKEIRDRLGVKPGWVAVQRVVDDHVEIYFLPPEHDESLKGSLAGAIRHRPAGADWGRAREEAWRAAAEQREQLPPPRRRRRPA
jgi:AbrB family looped-hinge helix DNA binding protein